MMKKILLFSSVLTISIIITSCAPTIYYQVYDTKSDEVKMSEDVLRYENEFVTINYNLWRDKGDIGFYLFNKTDSMISIDLSKSYYVVNGTSFDYYQKRTSTNTFTNNTHYKQYYYNYYGDSYSNNIVSTGTARQVSYSEKKIIHIPPHTGKSISEYNIVHELYRDCDLFLFPGKKDIGTTTFSENDSPLKFYNYLTYVFDADNQDEIVVKNEFWVYQITNYPKDKIVDSRNREFCEEKSVTTYEYFNLSRKDRFYIKYNREQNSMFKH